MDGMLLLLSYQSFHTSDEILIQKESALLVLYVIYILLNGSPIKCD